MLQSSLQFLEHPVELVGRLTEDDQVVGKQKQSGPFHTTMVVRIDVEANVVFVLFTEKRFKNVIHDHIENHWGKRVALGKTSLPTNLSRLGASPSKNQSLRVPFPDDRRNDNVRYFVMSHGADDDMGGNLVISFENIRLPPAE